MAQNRSQRWPRAIPCQAAGRSRSRKVLTKSPRQAALGEPPRQGTSAGSRPGARADRATTVQRLTTRENPDELAKASRLGGFLLGLLQSWRVDALPSTRKRLAVDAVVGRTCSVRKQVGRGCNLVSTTSPGSDDNVSIGVLQRAGRRIHEASKCKTCAGTQQAASRQGRLATKRRLRDDTERLDCAPRSELRERLGAEDLFWLEFVVRVTGCRKLRGWSACVTDASSRSGPLDGGGPMLSTTRGDMDAATFRKLGHELIDWVADYRERLERLPVMSPARPGEIRAPFRTRRRARAAGSPRRSRDSTQDVLPGITHWNHPSFFAYFPSNTSYASILADLVASGLGVQGMSWQTSPAATEVEEVVMDWLRQMVGLADAWTGVVHDTASTATLCALLCAREKASGFSQNARGLQGAGAPLVVYASSQAPQLDREGGAPRRLRQGQPASRRHRRRPRAARRPAGGGDRADRAAGRRPVRARRCHRHDGDDGDRSAGRDGRARRASTACGSTWTRRSRARRWCCPSAARCGTASSRPTAWCSTRTSGWAWASTSAPTTSATRST